MPWARREAKPLFRFGDEVQVVSMIYPCWQPLCISEDCLMFAGFSGWVRRAAHVILFLTALALPGVSSGAVPTSSVSLAWNASTDPTVMGYKIYYGVASG